MNKDWLWLALIFLAIVLWAFIGMCVDAHGFAVCNHCAIRPWNVWDIVYLVMTCVLASGLGLLIIVKGSQ